MQRCMCDGMKQERKENELNPKGIKTNNSGDSIIEKGVPNQELLAHKLRVSVENVL